MAQINTTVGDLSGNSTKIQDFYEKAVQQEAELIIFPELCLEGYPPRDLLLMERFIQKSEATFQKLLPLIGKTPAIIGHIIRNPLQPGRPLFNAASLIRNGTVEKQFFKRLLPTYDVFDEDRYFESGKSSDFFEFKDHRIGVTICEDLWNDADFWPQRRYVIDPVRELIEKGCEFILNLSASPWYLGKEKLREEMIRAVCLSDRIGIAQCNLVGGNDQLIFDGHSLALNSNGQKLLQMKGFEEGIGCLQLFNKKTFEEKVESFYGEEENLFKALVLGTKDYIRKCGFKKAIIGLSGGIDSALVAVIAVEAIGAENVMGVAMPARVSSQGSLDDAAALARNLDIHYEVIPIEASYQSVRHHFDKLFAQLPLDTTEENMQSRLRGLTLMSLSNKFGALVLTTGNKSELAVGYCTIYGDMCGGLAVISDVPKTMVYRLARWINREKETIPWASITKPPSAELRENQTDQDTLPPYDILDGILERYVERNESAEQIIKAGYDSHLVHEIIRKVNLNEYKRQQAAPGLKMTTRAFGIGRRMPIAQRFSEQ